MTSGKLVYQNMSNLQMEPKTCHIPCTKENYFIAQNPKRLATYVLVPMFEDSQVHRIVLA
jgi:hypothetical protein